MDSRLQILFLSESTVGKKHDKRLADECPYPLPSGSELLQDLGFQGFSITDTKTIMPMKKPKGKELTAEQKEANRQISSRRVRIEHVNSSVKRCRIVQETCRLFKDKIRDLVMEICCALHNFRVKLIPWKPMT